MVRVVTVLVLLWTWAFAITMWPDLPARMPMHFGMNGAPDRWAERSIWSWFWLPALATLFGVGFSWWLPAAIRSMARANSTWLNVPDRARFRTLSEAARLRVVEASMPGLHVIALSTVGLFGWSAWTTAQVALAERDQLPMWELPAFLVAVLGAAVWASLASKAAVLREAAVRDDDDRPSSVR